jgi:hypothetical protein
MVDYGVYLNQRSPSDPPAGLDVLIVNFLESLAAVTASSANEDVVTWFADILDVTIAKSAILAVVTWFADILDEIIALSSICVEETAPPILSKDTSSTLVPCE